MVGPVGVQHPQLGQAGVALLLCRKMVLDQLQVRRQHGQPQFAVQLLQLLRGELPEPGLV